MSDHHLENCPFCGSLAVLKGGPMAQETYSIWCTNKAGKRHHQSYGMDLDEAVADWNQCALEALVKPLEWVPEHGEDYKIYKAETAVGTYRYGVDTTGQAYWQGTTSGDLGADVASEDIARKLAFASYARELLASPHVQALSIQRRDAGEYVSRAEILRRQEALDEAEMAFNALDLFADRAWAGEFDAGARELKRQVGLKADLFRRLAASIERSDFCREISIGDEQEKERVSLYVADGARCIIVYADSQVPDDHLEGFELATQIHKKKSDNWNCRLFVDVSALTVRAELTPE